MRGSVGNSGNQGGKRLGVFRLGVSAHIDPIFVAPPHLCKMAQTNTPQFHKKYP